VRKAARRRELQLPQPEEVRYAPGGGVEALVEGRRVLVGDRRLLESRKVKLPELEWEAESAVVLVAVDGEVVGSLHVRDRVKWSAAGAISRLRRAGIRRLVLATGDRAEVAELVAGGLGLDECVSGVMPEGKAELVDRLRGGGRTVALVGDGMNDASALARADVGVAVASGADLARETADVSLLSDDLSALVSAVELSRQAMGLVRQNIGIVAVPNGAALGAAVAGRLAPLAAAFLNNGSTLVAAANGLRPLLVHE
jgi:P-type E1-E2 ATPase